MADSVIRESPLATLAQAPAAITECEFYGYINLRGNFDDSSFRKAVSEVCDINLPQLNNSYQRNDDFTLYWLGPDELLLVTQPDQQSAIETALKERLEGHFVAVTDVSSAYTALDISGAYAINLIAKGCPLNINPEVFLPGACAQTMLAQAPVIIAVLNDSPTFKVIVRRSFADYLMRWLIHLNNGF